VQRALILVTGPVIEIEHIHFEVFEVPRMFARAATAAPVSEAADPAPAVLADSIENVERELILQALRTGKGSRQAAADRLGISPRTLRYKLARLRSSGVEVPAA
jgi:two-component system response regulator FlrC